MAQQQFDSLEAKLKEIFVDKAPALPERVKQVLVDFAPWLSLVFGILSLFSGLALWHWAHDTTVLSKYASDICSTYVGPNCDAGVTRLTLSVWLALIVIVVEGVLYLMAFQGLRALNKQGWNYLYYGNLVNLAYAIVALFTSYNPVGNFIGSVIGSAIAFYFLFQIRSAYATDSVKVVRSDDHKIVEIETPPAKPAKKTAAKKPAAKKKSPAKKKPSSKK